MAQSDAGASAVRVRHEIEIVTSNSDAIFIKCGSDTVKFRKGTPSQEVLERLKQRWADGMLTDHEGFEITPSSPVLDPGLYDYKGALPGAVVGWQLRTLALVVAIFQIDQMVNNIITDNFDIRQHRHNHDYPASIIVLRYIRLVLGLCFSLIVLIGSVHTIGFLAETPPTLDFFHILFAVSRKAGTAFCMECLAALTQKMAFPRGPPVP